MPLWGKNDAVSNAMLYAAEQVGAAANASNRTTLFTNTTFGAVRDGQAIGLFAANNSETLSGRVAHAGWVLRTEGTGYVTNVSISAGGSSFTNGDVYRISAETGGANGTATVGTNSTGGIISLTLTNSGRFIKSGATAAVVNSTGGSTGGSGETLTYTLGGRAGRKQYETLVALTDVTGANTAIT